MRDRIPPDRVRDRERAETARPKPPFVTTDGRPMSDDAAIPGQTSAAPVIRLKSVSFYYGAFRAVKDIDITSPPIGSPH